LRALLADCGIDCQLIAPVEAEGQHVLVARGRRRSSRTDAAPGATAKEFTAGVSHA